MKKIEILTPNGWSNFDGVRSKIASIVELKTETKCLKCTLDHLVKDEIGFIEVSKLSPGKRILTSNGLEKVVYVKLLNKQEEVFDLLEVSNNNEYFTNGIISHNCSFQGSGNTLISPSALKAMTSALPLAVKDNLTVYFRPATGESHVDEDHIYIMTVDCSEGVGSDYTVATVIDVTTYPFRQVAQYRNNLISPLMLPSILVPIAKMYNNAWILFEINSAGKQVADLVRFDLEYENLLMTSVNERRRQQLMFGSGNEMIPGVRTTKSVKKIGCSHLKHLIENQKLVINDAQTIFELSNFTRKGDSFAAEEGYHDDTVMALVIFAWLVDQDFFKEITNSDVRKAMFAQLTSRFDDELPGIFSSTYRQEDIVVMNGAVWR